MPSPVRGGSLLPLSTKEDAKSNLKSAGLVTLVVQNSSLALFMKYSRSHTGKGPMYAATTAVVCAELVKVAVSLVLQAKVSDLHLESHTRVAIACLLMYAALSVRVAAGGWKHSRPHAHTRARHHQSAF
eukprot:14050-Heterococcus_DN1.PRE.4